jgi:transposase
MKKETEKLQIVNPNAAGIDVGAKSYMVAIDQNRSNVREFGVYTKDHCSMVEYFKQNSIQTIAMESTGSYWQTLFNYLQGAGFDVILVNGSQTKNVKGRKTDVLDCMWIHKLHSLGLLSGSFLLNDMLQELRTYYLHRQHLIEHKTSYGNRIEKSLRMMNIRLDIVLRDVTGKSGFTIIEAILNGERDPKYLAKLADIRVKKSQEEIANSLCGNWRPELLFELKSSLKFYKFYEQSLVECDKVIEQRLNEWIPVQSSIQENAQNDSTKRKSSKHSPTFGISKFAFTYFGTDLYQIPGVSHGTILCLLTNVGNDIHKFGTAKSFASWLRLAPNNKISGGKIISSRSPSGKNHIAIALRQAANSIGNQKDHPLTPFFKRIAFKKGRISAVTATAHKLAVIIWNMIVKKQSFRVESIVKNIEAHKQTILKNIENVFQPWFFVLFSSSTIK